MPLLHRRHDNRLVLAAFLTLLALGAASCARDLPTAYAPKANALAPAVRDGDEDADHEVMVTLVDGVDPAAFASSYDAALVQWEADARLAALRPATGETQAGLIARMAGDVRLVASENNAVVAPAEARQKSFAFDDGIHTQQSVVAQPAALALGLGSAQLVSRGQGVRVAIIDTGVDPNHSMLRGRIAASWDFVADRELALDQPDGLDNDGNGAVDEAYGHGTHVAGIVALVAPDARLLVARVLDADGQGDLVDVIAGIRWAVREGADVINLSLGTLEVSDGLTSAIRYADDHHVVVVAAAGNWGAATPIEYPAATHEVNAVAATDVDAVPAPFTSYGYHVKLAAPGVAIRSAYPGDTYRLWSGTSMSAPFVSGAAALLLNVHPTWNHELVMNRLGSTTRRVVAIRTLRDLMGDGMLDIGAALAPDYVPPPLDPVDPNDLPVVR